MNFGVVTRRLSSIVSPVLYYQINITRLVGLILTHVIMSIFQNPEGSPRRMKVKVLQTSCNYPIINLIKTLRSMIKTQKEEMS